MQEIYTSDQVAKILQVHPQTVLKFIREGKLKGSKVGRGYRVKAGDIEIFLEENAKQPTAKGPKNTEAKKEKDKDVININFPLDGGHYVIQ